MLSADTGMNCFLFSVLLLVPLAQFSSASSAELMKDFDFQKFIKQRWWVTYRSKKFKHYDRCICIGFGKFFKDKDYFVEVDHEMSGAIDRSYHPVSPHETGYHFSVDGGDEGRVDFVETDYSTYAIAMLTMKDQSKDLDHIAIITKEAAVSDDLEKTIGTRLQELAGIALDSIEKINNEDCPVDVKTQQAL